MKINKPKLLLEIVIFIALLVYVFQTVVIPNYSKMFGSSDKFVNTTKYRSLVEFKVGEVNFGIVLNKNKEVYHIFYFDEESTCLYNQNIENNSLDGAINQIIRRLIENNYLKTDTKITIIQYENEIYKSVKKSFKTYLNKYHLNNEIKEEKNTLISKSKSITEDNITSESYALLVIDLYSKEFVETAKENSTKNVEITDKTSKKYANNIYMKLEKAAKNSDELLDITKVPGDEYGNVFPTENSYYSIKNSKVYAYIEIQGLNNNYSYCYNGSIDDYKKGECE